MRSRTRSIRASSRWSPDSIRASRAPPRTRARPWSPGAQASARGTEDLPGARRGLLESTYRWLRWTSPYLPSVGSNQQISVRSQTSARYCARIWPWPSFVWLELPLLAWERDWADRIETSLRREHSHRHSPGFRTAVRDSAGRRTMSGRSAAKVQWLQPVLHPNPGPYRVRPYRGPYLQALRQARERPAA
jgi:hypothetical protein